MAREIQLGTGGWRIKDNNDGTADYLSPSGNSALSLQDDGSIDTDDIQLKRINDKNIYVKTEAELFAAIGAGNTVIIPTGTTINANDPVILGDNDHLHIQQNATLRQADSSNVQTFRCFVQTLGNNITVDGPGTIDVNAANQGTPSYRGVGDVQGSGSYENLRIKNITIQNAGERNPVELSYTSDVWVTDCRFGGGGQFDTGAVAIEARGGQLTNLNIRGNIVRPLDATRTGDVFFVDSTTDSGYKVRRFSLVNNTVQGRYGTRTTNESGMWWAFLVEEGGQSGIIANNTVRAETGDGSGGGIFVNSQTGAGGTGTITVTGNTVRGDPNATNSGGAMINGLVISAGTPCTVTGNYVTSFEGNNGAINDAPCVVTGNKFDDSLYTDAPNAVIGNNG